MTLNYTRTASGVLIAATLFASLVPFARAEETPLPLADPPAGVYKLDKAHTSITFRVSHLGFSMYTARFTRFDGELKFDPSKPAEMSVTATIDPKSLETDNTDPSYDFDAILQGKDWLDAAQFPEITFRSTTVEVTDEREATVTGDLTLHGVTKPVTLVVTYNGGYGSNAFDPGGARIGFSARGKLKRSEFGISLGIPPPGSNMGVGDDVEIIIETELQKPVAPAP